MFAAPAFTRDLWTPDEPRYALVAQEMLQSGDWVVLHRNGEVYREKPPLLFWAIAALSAPFGSVNEITARMPSILAALATLWLTFDLARRMFGETAGLWSALVLATTFRFWWQSNTGQIDMLLTACTTLSVYALWRWHEAQGGRWAFAYHAGAALGLLAKGPPALVFTLFSAAGFFWRRRDERRGLLLWLGVPVSILPVAAWFYLARTAGTGEVAGEVSGTFARQVVGRMFAGVSHAQPPWHYLMNLPIEWFPWVLIAPWTAMHAWRTRREGPAMRLLLSWFVPSLIFFHIIIEKRSVYLLPLYPPLAILMARSVIALVDEGRRGWLRTTAVMWLPIACAAAISPFFAGYTSSAGGERPIMYLLTIVGVLCAVWTAAILWAKAWRHWPTALGAQAAALFLAVGIGAFPVVDQHKSSKEFCSPVRALVRAGDVNVMSVRLLREEYIFYSNTSHEVVLLFPGVSELGEHGDSAAQDRARTIRYAMVNACASLSVKDYASPTTEEREALQAAVDRVVAEADLTDEEEPRYRAAVARDVAMVMDALRTDTPGVVFSNSGDWRWVLAFAEDASFLNVLKNEQVSSRDMVLFANPAAMRVLGGGRSSASD